MKENSQIEISQLGRFLPFFGILHVYIAYMEIYIFDYGFMHKMANIVMGFSGIGLMLGGIGIFKKKLWARRLVIGSCIVLILLNVGRIVHKVVLGELEIYERHPGIFFDLFLLWFYIMPVIILTRTSIKKQFNSN